MHSCCSQPYSSPFKTFFRTLLWLTFPLSGQISILGIFHKSPKRRLFPTYPSSCCANPLVLLCVGEFWHFLVAHASQALFVHTAPPLWVNFTHSSDLSAWTLSSGEPFLNISLFLANVMLSVKCSHYTVFSLRETSALKFWLCHSRHLSPGRSLLAPPSSISLLAK